MFNITLPSSISNLNLDVLNIGNNFNFNLSTIASLNISQLKDDHAVALTPLLEVLETINSHIDRDTQVSLLRAVVLIGSYLLLRPQLEKFLAWINGGSTPAARQEAFLARLKARAKEKERADIERKREQLRLRQQRQQQQHSASVKGKRKQKQK